MNKVEGIIIRAYPCGEADLVLKVISRSSAKMSLFAKHARKSRRRFSSSFDLFDRGHFEIKTGHGQLHTVTGFTPAPSMIPLRDDLDKYTIAVTICECFDLLVPEELSDGEEYYNILELGLQALADAGDLREALRACFLSLVSLLRTAGYLNPGLNLEPGTKNLLKILDVVETQAEKKLSTGQAITALFGTLASDKKP